MVLRITRDDEKTSRVTLKLEGRLVRAWAEFLERECAVLLGSFDYVGIDLSGVAIVDRSGVEALERLHRAGVEIRGCSDLVASILESDGIFVDRSGNGTR